MKIAKKQKSKKKRILIITTIILLIIASGGIAYAIMNSRTTDENPVDYNPPTEEQRKAGETIKQKSIEAEEEEASDEPNRGEVTIEITSINQNDGQLQLRTLIHTLDGGECALTLSGPNNQSKQYSATTQPFASSSSCQGFNIPVSELSSGQWQAEIIFTSDQSRGSATQNITIE